MIKFILLGIICALSNEPESSLGYIFKTKIKGWHSMGIELNKKLKELASMCERRFLFFDFIFNARAKFFPHEYDDMILELNTKHAALLNEIGNRVPIREAEESCPGFDFDFDDRYGQPEFVDDENSDSSDDSSSYYKKTTKKYEKKKKKKK
eukprot:GHVL01016112.1.p1 GENE.GHVL01016112.1~~GHVL01016112.1.p1  ORF type:complete len:151 (+),score=33.97 GHVL01016112.1:65-517(+)